jgi:uncharacterized protein (TIGR02328 family)
MRLWHIDLIPYLPKSQLLAQWRELNSIFKKQDKHILFNYIYNYDKRYLLNYSQSVMREMLNKVTFFTNIIFMILNNASCIIQWMVLYSLKDNIGGYTFNQMLLLWGIASATFGFSKFFFM